MLLQLYTNAVLISGSARYDADDGETSTELQEDDMSQRLAFAAVFAAAGLMTSAASAGSPYYDANGQPVMSGDAAIPSAPLRSKSAAGRLRALRTTPPVDQGSVAAASRPSSVAALPKMDADGFIHKESDSSLYEHATGSDGSVAESDAIEAPTPEPIYNAPMPRMDADGFIHKQGDSSLYEHAIGSDGSVAESDAVDAPKPAPIYNAPMPRMDADGFIHKESNSSYYGHAMGSDGSP